ncbi:MAG: hypothetical protein JWO86_555, partial [Myxococcaceae bacterium]|nr:hypothetical protein [Myxococcaceae bacterium]
MRTHRTADRSGEAAAARGRARDGRLWARCTTTTAEPFNDETTTLNVNGCRENDPREVARSTARGVKVGVDAVRRQRSVIERELVERAREEVVR